MMFVSYLGVRCVLRRPKDCIATILDDTDGREAVDMPLIQNGQLKASELVAAMRGLSVGRSTQHGLKSSTWLSCSRGGSFREYLPP